ncbi:acyltransferase family protein [Klebsiella quasipneumoniae]|uniref:acyltransferase family protein n=1 Tax=Klebsiella quasipneumoniae TaxID=1463165 RepID=UPI003F6DDD98
MREVWVDYAKALGIILVVAGHVNRGLYSSGIYISKQFYTLFDSIIYTFHMPLFFFLSGLFFVKSIDRKGKKLFFIDKIDTIFYPYVLWSLFQGGIEVILSKYTNSKTELTDVLSFLIYPRAQFWFLYALLMIFIVAALIYKKESFSKSLPLIILASFVIYIFSNAIGESFHINYITNYIIFFFMGCIYHKLSLTEKINSGWGSLLLIFLIFGIAQYIFHIKLGLVYTDTGLFTFALATIGITFITLLSMQLEKIKIHALETIGILSMVIYLLHILSASGARIILSKLLHVQNWYIHIIIGISIGIIVPVAVYFFTKWYNINFLFSLPRQKKVSS